MQEREGEVGLEEHPAEEVPGAEEGSGEVGDEDLEVEELFDYYDPDDARLHRGISTPRTVRCQILLAKSSVQYSVYDCRGARGDELS